MKQDFPLRVTISVMALLMAISHIYWPQKIDSIFIGVLAIGALPWLQSLVKTLVKTIELPGVKLELRDNEARSSSRNLELQVAFMQSNLAALRSSLDALQPSLPQVKPVEAGSANIKALAHKYEEIRKVQRSGDARTAAMTDVFRRMIDVARRTELFDIMSALRDSSSGMRLFAYAYLYTRPDEQFLAPLVEAISSKEEVPFNQYWGLQSIGRVVAKAEHMPPEIKDRLRAFGATLEPDTDRAYEIRKLLRQE